MYDYEDFEFQSQYQDDLDALAELENDEMKFSEPNTKSPYNVNQLRATVQTVSLAAYEDDVVSAVLDDIVNLIRSPERPQKSTKKRDFSEGEDTSDKEETGLPSTKRQRRDSRSRTSHNKANQESNNDGRKILRRIPNGDYVSLTSSSSRKRIYMRLRSESSERTTFKCGRSSGISNLLQSSYDDLRLQIEREREAKLLKEIEMVCNETESSTTDYDSLQTYRRSEEVEAENEISSLNDLWVEKFKPNNYLELLSDDGTNRSLLRWLKLWDKVVFKKEIKILREKEEKGSAKTAAARSRFVTRKNTSEVNKELDQWDRPSQKVALLCGPPGLGKTTVAHIVAKHAGYNVVEMNASDDRSPEAFRNQIEAATQMRSVLGTNRRPNCLIIDEIDGAPLMSINVLVAIMSAKPRDSSNATTSTRKKGHKDQGFLLRPIICICNDQYVPALRPLRNLALLLNFPQTLASRLSSRLLEISRKEQLKVDTSSLLALCEKAENDIRSCLHTLQFVHRRGKEFRMSDVRSLSVGRKDVQRSLFSVWQDIFHLPKSNRSFVPDRNQETDCSSLSERFLSILRLAQSYGDYEKIHQGLFENYINAKYKDHRMNKASYGIDWLCFSDLINQEIHHTQNYSLMPYLPFTSVTFHLIFACNSYFKLSFPTSHFDLIAKVTKSTNILQSMVSDLSPVIRCHVNSSLMILELIPLLLDIICPNLRQVNTQLYSTQEKAQLDHLINVMVLYGLVYKQELGLDGQYNYVLDHPIDQVAHFSGCAPRRQLTYATKQMISREIELEKLRKHDATHKIKESTPVVKVDLRLPSSSSVPNHLKRLQPKGIKETNKPMKDFFGRIIESKQPNVNKQFESSLGKDEVWFHFKEGYSNAVRKNVCIKDLL